MTKAVLIPVAGPVEEIELDGTLEQLNKLVGGHLEAVPVPWFDAEHTDANLATAYIHDEGKFVHAPNMRATDFMVPGIGLWASDYISGPFVLSGFDPNTGENTDVPDYYVKRARLIEQEAGL